MDYLSTGSVSPRHIQASQLGGLDCKEERSRHADHSASLGSGPTNYTNLGCTSRGAVGENTFPRVLESSGGDWYGRPAKNGGGAMKVLQNLGL